jgi:hypothetical protein
MGRNGRRFRIDTSTQVSGYRPGAVDTILKYEWRMPFRFTNLPC